MGGASKLLTLVVAPVPRLYFFPPAALRLPLSRPLSTVPSRRLLVSRPRRHALALRVTAAHQLHTQASLRNTFPHPSSALLSHEWSRLVDHLKSFGHSEGRISVLDAGEDDAFLDGEDLSEEFLKMAEVCLSFARDRPEVLRLLPRKDVEVVVENGSPFLFMNGVNSVRRMKAFLCGNGSDVLQSETAQTVDLMRYLLSYKRGSLNTDTTHDGMELIECSVRNLLTELVNLCGGGQQSNITESTRRMPPLGHEQFSRLPRPNIEMKRGDWICPKCSFMNFAKNMKCLECDETRPKRQLAGGEWECPQCDFFNYGRNRSCLRCDCKRPGDSALNAGVKGNVLGPSRDSSIDQIFNGSNSDKSEIERRLAANDEKAERWFSKMSQLDDTSDLSSAIADEDFPEIMPLRKGTNRFVVSTRKTPLERRLANVQYRRNLESPGNSQSGGFSGTGSEKTTESSISESLDRILGRSSDASGASGATNQSANGEMNSGAASRFNLSEHRQSISQQGDTGYVPFVPLNPDMFRKSPKPDNDGHQSSVQVDSSSVKSVQPSGYTDSVFGSSGSSNVLPAGNLESPVESKEEAGSSEASERWHTKATELDNVVDSATSISNDDFPEIMPMRKGENRFVVSKKKDRSLTSPQYKRRLALEQSNSSNFVPFVPFPPGYFAKKDKQPEAATSVDASIESSLPAEKAEAGMLEDKSGDAKSVSAGYVPRQEKQSSTENTNHYNGAAAQTFEAPTNYWNNSKDSGNSDVSQRRNAFGSANTMGNLPQRTENSQNTEGSWNGGFSGKSLEGSAVKEPDPLDMSEEAKAERWFRRAAQIKDISELSQIPDEDFPEIMPMRKGVNRFVVSKRKTPLERRLTSAQYRRNLPIVSSEPKNDAS